MHSARVQTDKQVFAKSVTQLVFAVHLLSLPFLGHGKSQLCVLFWNIAPGIAYNNCKSKLKRWKISFQTSSLSLSVRSKVSGQCKFWFMIQRNTLENVQPQSWCVQTAFWISTQKKWIGLNVYCWTHHKETWSCSVNYIQSTSFHRCSEPLLGWTGVKRKTLPKNGQERFWHSQNQV